MEVIDEERIIEEENLSKDLKDERIMIEKKKESKGGEMIEVEKEDIVIGEKSEERIEMEIDDEEMEGELKEEDIMGMKEDKSEEMEE